MTKTPQITVKSSILSSLRQRKNRRHGLTARQLADFSGSHTQTVYATVSTLISSGYEINKRVGRDGFKRYSIAG